MAQEARDAPGEQAQAWLAGAAVGAAVTALAPGFSALIIVAAGLQPGPSDAASERLLDEAERSAREHLGARAPEELDQVAEWRAAYRAFGAKPQRTRPSLEALLRRLGTGLPRVDRLTDAYNAVSISHLLPLGGEDLDRYVGPARLVRASGDEPFDTTSGGEPAVEAPEPGEVVWRDDEGVTCRRWNWRQCHRTRITTSTRRAVFILDGLPGLGRDGLDRAGDALVENLRLLSPDVTVLRRQI